MVSIRTADIVARYIMSLCGHEAAHMACSPNGVGATAVHRNPVSLRTSRTLQLATFGIQNASSRVHVRVVLQMRRRASSNMESSCIQQTVTKRRSSGHCCGQEDLGRKWSRKQAKAHTQATNVSLPTQANSITQQQSAQHAHTFSNCWVRYVAYHGM